MDIHRCRRVCATPDFHYLGNDDIRVLSLFSISCPEGLNGDEMMYLPMIWGTEERVGCGDSPCGFTCFLETFSWSKSVANCTRVTFVTMDRLNASMPVHSAMTPESGGRSPYESQYDPYSHIRYGGDTGRGRAGGGKRGDCRSNQGFRWDATCLRCSHGRAAQRFHAMHMPVTIRRNDDEDADMAWFVLSSLLWGGRRPGRTMPNRDPASANPMVIGDWYPSAKGWSWSRRHMTDFVYWSVKSPPDFVDHSAKSAPDFVDHSSKKSA